MPTERIAVEYDAAAGVLRVAGDLDGEAIDAVREAMAQHSQVDGPGLVVDLTDLTYCPSAAVAMLVSTTRLFMRNGTPFEIAARTGSIAHRVLTLCAIAHREY